MSDEKVKIILKSEYKKAREITVGNKSVKAIPGKAVEVVLGDLQMWLNTGRFELVEEIQTVSDLPTEIPGRAALIKAEINAEKVSTMTREQLIDVTGIGEKTADEILKFLEDSKGGQE